MTKALKLSACPLVQQKTCHYILTTVIIGFIRF
jgi:hypothetical protein